MNKRIISVLLIICLTFSTSATVFAQNTSSTYIQNEQGKSISYIGDYKLVYGILEISYTQSNIIHKII